MKRSHKNLKKIQNKEIRKARYETYLQDDKHIISNEEKNKHITSPNQKKILQHKLRSKKTSHMTSPKDVTWHTEPEHIHAKGENWIQTIQKKTRYATQKLNNKMQKLLNRK